MMSVYIKFVKNVDFVMIKELVDLIEVAEATLYSRHKDFNIFEVIR